MSWIFDITAGVSLILVAVGAGLYSAPAALVVVGVGGLAGSLLAARAYAKSQRRPAPPEQREE
jgi:hypothetical protein